MSGGQGVWNEHVSWEARIIRGDHFSSKWILIALWTNPEQVFEMLGGEMFGLLSDISALKERYTQLSDIFENIGTDFFPQHRYFSSLQERIILSVLLWILYRFTVTSGWRARIYIRASQSGRRPLGNVESELKVFIPISNLSVPSGENKRDVFTERS